VVRGIDRVAGKKRSRSAVIDDVLRGYLFRRERAAANARDAETINRFADELSVGMQDVLAYQSLDLSRPVLWHRPLAGYAPDAGSSGLLPFANHPLSDKLSGARFERSGVPAIASKYGRGRNTGCIPAPFDIIARLRSKKPL
jgi:hypothetical protein